MTLAISADVWQVIGTLFWALLILGGVLSAFTLVWLAHTRHEVSDRIDDGSWLAGDLDAYFDFPGSE